MRAYQVRVVLPGISDYSYATGSSGFKTKVKVEGHEILSNQAWNVQRPLHMLKRVCKGW